MGWKVCDARSEKRRVARVGDSAHLFGSIELTFVHDRPVLVVGVGKNVKWCPPVHLFDLDRFVALVLDSPGGRAAHVTMMQDQGDDSPSPAFLTGVMVTVNVSGESS